MGLVDRYLVKKLVKYIFIISFFSNAIYLFVDFMGRFSTFARHKVGLGLLFYYYLLKLPESIHYTFPFSILIASIITFSILDRRNELMVLKATGMSLGRLILFPFLTVLFFTIPILFNAANLTKLMGKARDIYAYRMQGEKTGKYITKEGIWIKGKRSFLRFEGLTRDGFKGLVWIKLDKKFKPVWRLDGKVKKISGRYVILSEGRMVRFGKDIEVSYVKNYRIKIPKDVMASLSRVTTLPRKSLKDIFLLSKRAYLPRFYRINVVEKIFFSLSSLVFFLIGLVMSLRIKTKAKIGVEFGIAFILTFFYWVIHSIFYYISISKGLNPYIATNISNIIFFLPPFFALVWGSW